MLERIVTALPEHLLARISRELMRRRMPGFSPAALHTMPFWELVFVLQGRFNLPAQISGAILNVRNRVFDHRIAQRIATMPPDVIIGHETSTAQSFASARRYSTKTVMNKVSAQVDAVVRLMREEAEIHPEFADSLSLGPVEMFRKIWPDERDLSDAFLVPSEYARQTLLADGVPANKLYLVPYGVAVDSFQPTKRSCESVFRVLFVGRVSQAKGIKYLLEAVKKLALPDLELLLVGSVIGSGRGLRPYQDYFRHIPNVPHSEIHKYFNSANVFVFPSLHEGCSLAVLEAMAAGLPIVTTVNAGSVVRDSIDGYIVPIRDTDALADRILRLYKDRTLCEEMGGNARRQAEEHSWAHYAERLKKALETIMG